MNSNPLGAVSAVNLIRSPKLADSPEVDALGAAIAQVEHMVLGKPREVRLAFACLLAGGHLLLDDRPGTGKTTLARSIATTVGLDFNRVQFTSDLMPSDILGVSVLDGGGGFRFHPGPVFTHVLLADEINRASPRVQSALLEAMAERQVSIDGDTMALPDPFFVIATQNPVDLSGTFPLPDSQLDRFLFRLHLGYPDDESELLLLRSEKTHDRLQTLKSQLDVDHLRALQKRTVGQVVSEAVVRYIHSLVKASRNHSGIRVGLSPRAGLALLDAVKAWALINGRTHVLPDDVQDLFVQVAAHRLTPKADRAGGAEGQENERVRLAQDLLDKAVVP